MKQLLPITIIGLATALYSCTGSPASEQKAAAPVEKKTVYQTAPANKAGVAQSIKLSAQLAAYQEVTLFPKVNGYVKNMLVDIGSRVQKGQLLMTLEAPELEQQAMQAKEKYARTKSDFTIDRDNYLRLKEAAETPGAVSPMDLASAKAKADADSALSNAEKANWQFQETMLSYLRITAPFDGVITERNVHVGALASATDKQKPMLELKQDDHLRLQVDIPEGVAAGLTTNDNVVFYLSAFPGKKMSAKVSRISHNVNMQYRTERVEMDVPNSKGNLTPGMYADVLLDTRGNPDALTVPRSAVVTSTERKYVIVVRNGITAKVDVATGNETTGSVEIIGDVKPGEQVIANASDDIKEGIHI